MLKTLDNSLEILEMFTKEKPSWGVRELAQELNMSHSVVYRVLKTFEKHRFLRQDKLTERYEFGIRLLEYGIIVKNLYPFESQIKMVMQDLSQNVRENTFLTWLDNNECLCLEIGEVQNSVKFSVEKGSRTPIYAGASNRAIMAYLPEEEIDNIIEKGIEPITPMTVIKPEKLKKSLEEIRLGGYSLTVGEYTKDVTGLAVPLFDSENKIIASLTIAGPSYRIDEEKINSFLPLLKEAGAKIQPYIRHF